jgi:hypothetical protein
MLPQDIASVGLPSVVAQGLALALVVLVVVLAALLIASGRART